MSILIISSSIRTGRASHRVAKFFETQLREQFDKKAEIFDLLEVDFPLFHERLQHLENPPKSATDFAKKVEEAEAVIVVSPEYNGGYPAAFKNAFDLLYKEWKHKPIGIASVSAGAFGGSQVQQQIQLLFIKVGAVPIGVTFSVPTVTENFDVLGQVQSQKIKDRAKVFLKELIDYAERFK